MYINKELIGKKIKEYRKKNKLSQAELAEMVSLSDKHIGRIEAGKYLPNFLNFLKILEVLQIDFLEFGLNPIKTSNSTKKELLNIIYSSSDKEVNLYLKIIKTLKEEL
ncbi:MAG: helix-turn-helix domain-containing protein [Candidatus Gastranaerophilaceae bacterium]